KEFSTLQRLVGVTAYLLRVSGRAKSKQRFATAVATVAERDAALKYWIKKVQSVHFGLEIERIMKNKPIQSQLNVYNPFLDKDGILRVGGRLRNAEQLDGSTRNPILLPKHSHLSTLIVRDCHWRNMH